MSKVTGRDETRRYVAGREASIETGSGRGSLVPIATATSLVAKKRVFS